MSSVCGWPEQDAIATWWQENSHALKEAVTQPRLKEMQRAEELEAKLKKLTRALEFYQDGENWDGGACARMVLEGVGKGL